MSAYNLTPRARPARPGIWQCYSVNHPGGAKISATHGRRGRELPAPPPKRAKYDSIKVAVNGGSGGGVLRLDNHPQPIASGPPYRQRDISNGP